MRESVLRPGVSAGVRARGYSVLELLVVMAIVAVMIGLSLASFSPRRSANRADDAALHLVAFLREAHGRALAERQTMRVEVDTRAEPRVVRIVDENTLGGARDDRVVREELLVGPSEVVMSVPDGAGAPPAPFDFAAARLESALWSVRFTSEGAAVDADGVPTSATLYFAPPSGPGDAVRAVTLFGPSASVRFWKRRSVPSGFAFVAEGR